MKESDADYLDKIINAIESDLPARLPLNKRPLRPVQAIYDFIDRTELMKQVRVEQKTSLNRHMA